MSDSKKQARLEAGGSNGTGAKRPPERSGGGLLAEGRTGGPDPEVLERPVRRTFTAEYKRAILREADACTKPGEIGALLRREGLYSSHLSKWRRQRERGELEALAPKKRGRKPKAKNPLARKVAELERENAKLRGRLQQAEAIIEIQKKPPRSWESP